jgi:hypothetical protein
MTRSLPNLPPIKSHFWLCVIVFVFLGIEWGIMFHSDLWNSLSVFRDASQQNQSDKKQLDKLKGATQSPQNKDAPQGDPDAKLKIWIVYSLAETIAGAATAYVSVKWLVELWGTGDREGRLKRIIALALRIGFYTLIVIFISPADMASKLTVYGGRVSLYGAGVLPIVFVGVIASTMWVVQSRAKALDVATLNRELLVSYTGLRNKLQVLLTFASLLLAAGVASMLVRRGVVASCCPTQLFSKNLILLRGMEFSFLLALAYVPVHATMSDIGRRIRDTSLAKIYVSDGESLQTWAKRSSDLDDALQLKLNEWKSLGPGFAIFAPVLIGLLSHIAETHL